MPTQRCPYARKFTGGYGLCVHAPMASDVEKFFLKVGGVRTEPSLVNIVTGGGVGEYGLQIQQIQAAKQLYENSHHSS